jgi:type IV secretory pathway VirB10-like protein
LDRASNRERDSELMETKTMIKRLTIAAVAAALIAVLAQSASAAISKPVGPAAQAPEQAPVQPVADEGFGSSPGASEPDAADPAVEEPTPPAPAEQAASASPPTSPGTDPSGPEVPAYETTAKDDGQEPASDEECAQLDSMINAAIAMASMFERIAGALPGTDAGSYAQERAESWAEEAAALTDLEFEGGCNAA